MSDFSNVPEEIKNLIERIKAAGFEVYLVGGCVRDMLLGWIPGDYDVCTSATPDEIKVLFNRVVNTGLRFGTVMVKAGRYNVEVTTFRTGLISTDGKRLKAAGFSKNVIEDVSKRDFTINALLFDGEKVIDYVAGLADLASGIIRAVGSAKERFAEDPLRMLRAVRLSGQLNFNIEKNTKEAIIADAPKLSAVSAERIRDELKKIVLLPIQSGAIKLLHELGLWEAIFPKLSWTPLVEKLTGNTRPNLFLRIAALIKGSVFKPGCSVQGILRNLRFDRNLVSVVSMLILEEIPVIRDWSALEKKKMINRVGVKHVNLLFDFWRAQVLSGTSDENIADLDKAEEEVMAIIERGEPLQISDLAIKGDDLINAGICQGPEIRRVLNSILEKVLEKPDLNDRETLVNIISQYSSGQ
ncbi:CCA tRNA nucleotidyltransferase [Thermincola ferriacetica]